MLISLVLAASCCVTHDPNSELQEVVGDAERVQSKWWIVRLLRATDYAERIESWVKKLDQRIHTFLVSINP